MGEVLSFLAAGNELRKTKYTTLNPSIKEGAKTIIEDISVKNNETFGVKLPQQVTFAGEVIPMENMDVRERLDRELLVNSYWHSSTILMHKRANRWLPYY